MLKGQRAGGCMDSWVDPLIEEGEELVARLRQDADEIEAAIIALRLASSKSSLDPH